MSQDVTPAFDRLVGLVHQIRTNCPWCVAQTHESLVKHLIEETAEVVEAIENSAQVPVDLREELGDVLFQVLFHTDLASQEGYFELAELIDQLSEKLIKRHPWVFADAEDPADMMATWEAAKRKEKNRQSVLEGIAQPLATLAKAAKVIDRAANLPGWENPGSNAEEISADEFKAQFLQLVGQARAAGLDPDQLARQAINELSAEITQFEQDNKAI